MADANADARAAVPSRVSEETIKKAVDALVQWLKSQSMKTNKKPQLLEDKDEDTDTGIEASNLIYLVMTLKKIPTRPRTNPFKIPLPHPLFTSPTLQLCLIVDDRPNSPLAANLIKSHIKSHNLPISKVLKLSKLKSHFRPFEAKRKLSASYDLFFADKRILPLLPKLLGKPFFKTKKIPVPVDLSRKNWDLQIRHVCSSTLLYLRSGTCSILKVARASQPRDDIVHNVAAVIAGAAQLLPKKWDNVRSFHLKSLESLALPLYQAMPSVGLKIDGVKSEGMESDGAVTDSLPQRQQKTVGKRGRIHEVKYMDDENGLGELMADMVDDDDDNSDDHGERDHEIKKKNAEKKSKLKNSSTGDDGSKVKMAAKRRKTEVGNSSSSVATAKEKVVAKKNRAAKVSPIAAAAAATDDDDDDDDDDDGNNVVNESELKKGNRNKKKLIGDLSPKKTEKTVAKKGSVKGKLGSLDGDGVSDRKKQRTKVGGAEGRVKTLKKVNKKKV